jgi:hypothetical protein
MRPSFLVAALLVFSACDGPDPEPTPEPLSSFEASVAGDATLVMGGPSWVVPGLGGVDPTHPDLEIDSSVQIGMTDFVGRGGSRGGLMFTLDGPLEVGEYDLAPQEDLFLRPRATLIVGELRSASYADGVSGTLTVTRADSAEVAGTFRFVTEAARDGYWDAEDPTGNVRPFAVTVEGAFEADVIGFGDRPDGDWPVPIVAPRPLP